MLPFRYILCLYMPWHKFVKRVKLSPQSDYFRCSCGKEYAINYEVHVVVPFDEVRSVYDKKVLNRIYR